MPPLVAGIQASKAWMAGTSPTGANIRCPRAFFSLAPLLPSGRLRPSATGYGEGRGDGRGASEVSDSRIGPLTRNLREGRANSDLSPTEVGFTRLRHLKRDRNRQQPISIA